MSTTEKELHDAEQRLRVIADNLDTVVWMTRPGESRILYLGPAFERVWGVRREEIYGDPGSWMRYVHPDDRERVAREIAERREQRPPIPEPQVYRIVRPDGEIRWVRARIFPVLGADGSVDRVIGMADDITLQKAAEQAAEQSGQELEQSRERLRLEELRIKIAADLHDDIGSTLSSTSIFNAMLRQMIDPGNSGATALLNRIDENLRNVQESLHDIVWAIDPENDGLETVALRMREFAAETLEGKGIALRLDAADIADPARVPMRVRRDLYLLFKEAVANVVNHSECTEAFVRIAPQGRCLHLEITDNGKGFRVGERARGNGLANMEARARAIGATLRIRSEPGRGTSVVVELPIA